MFISGIPAINNVTISLSWKYDITQNSYEYLIVVIISR